MPASAACRWMSCQLMRVLGQTGLVPAEDPWAPLAERFVDQHCGTLRGRVRTYVIASYVRDHLPRPPATLIDVGAPRATSPFPSRARGTR